jgi:hypothetical protein
MALLFVGNACLGLVMPATFVLALEEQGRSRASPPRWAARSRW